jgi:hypothetical protein
MSDWMQDALFPLLGGVILGASAGALYLVDGRIAGVSGIVKNALLREGRWRLIFLAGLICAGLVWTLRGGAPSAALAATPVVVLIVGGLLVGLGSGMASGCTSGHGVCGLARFSLRSLTAVAVFMTSAAVTVLLARMAQS